MVKKQTLLVKLPICRLLASYSKVRKYGSEESEVEGV